ncbi:MAG: (2Fe-2S) ferredoxin domain-containing protein [Syntrophotaleaceae bacterium]
MEYFIKICMGSSCYSRGNQENLARIERYLGEHQIDCSVDLRGSRCEGLCSEGPIVEINGQIHGGVTVDTIDTLLHKHLLVKGREVL